MARIRSVKPEFWLDRKLARKLSRDERMLYMGLWNQADEHGRALGDPVVVKGAVFPYDDDLTVDVIDRMLNSLDAAGVVQRYEVDGDPYLFLPKLKDHQRLEPGKSKSKHPEPPPRSGATTVPDASEQTGEYATVFSDTPPAPEHEIDNNSANFGSEQHEQCDLRSATIFSDESAHDPGKKSLLYGTGSMEQGGAAQTSPRGADPPPPHCANHPGGTPDPCGPCADARRQWIAANLARDQRLAAEAAAKARVEAEQRRLTAELRARAASACDLCDDDGYAGGRVCDHDPESAERARRGVAGARAVLAAKRAEKAAAESGEQTHA